MTILRPIGTRFKMTCSPSKSSTGWMATEYECEVVSHIKTARYPGDTEGSMAEEIRFLSYRNVLPDYITINADGSMTVFTSTPPQPDDA